MLQNTHCTLKESESDSVLKPSCICKTGNSKKTYGDRCAFEDGAWGRDAACDKREVLWSITGNCNYRCRHCFMSAPKAKFLEPDREQLLDIVHQIDSCGIRNVSLTGGEPLISPYLFDIIAEMKRMDIRLSMIHTNGALVSDRFLNKLEEMKVHPSFQISFDGIGWHDWMRGVPGAEQAALNALRLLHRGGYRTGVTMVLHRNNMCVVNDSIRLLKELGVEHIKMHVATPSGLWANETQHFISQDEANQLLYDSIIPRFFEDGADIGVQFCAMLEYFPDRQECAIPAARFDGTKNSEECFACAAANNNPYISPEGYVLSCMHLAGTAMQSSFDNLHIKPLREILTESRYRDTVRLRLMEVLDHNARCQDCAYRLFCGAGCRAHACGENGTDYLGIDWETCNFFQNGWYEKALDLCRRYGPRS